MATVLITGANRGIGLELVKEYAVRGDTVIACCRDPRAATALAAVPGKVEVHELDVADADSVAALATALRARPIDILVNNAGILGPDYPQQTAFEMDFDGWARRSPSIPWDPCASCMRSSTTCVRANARGWSTSPRRWARCLST
jgi:NAD(P)-dependent dehydrogenase (short-subunit alcohol dehydrogenase family)